MKTELIIKLEKRNDNETVRLMYTTSHGSITCKSMEVPVVRKNNPMSKPLNGLISASICVLKFVSAKIAPAKNAPSCIMIVPYNCHE